MKDAHIIVEVGIFADGSGTRCYQLYRARKVGKVTVYEPLEDKFPNDPRELEVAQARLRALKDGPESEAWAEVMDDWDAYRGREPGSWRKEKKA